MIMTKQEYLEFLDGKAREALEWADRMKAKGYPNEVPVYLASAHAYKHAYKMARLIEEELNDL